MKLVDDLETETWLMTRPGLQWDGANTGKLGKHGVTVEEVEAIFDQPFAFAGRIVEPAHDEPRWQALGVVGRRYLSLVFTRRGDLIRPISCRTMRPNERSRYGKASGN